MVTLLPQETLRYVINHAVTGDVGRSVYAIMYGKLINAELFLEHALRKVEGPGFSGLPGPDNKLSRGAGTC